MNKENLGNRIEFIYGFSVRVNDEIKGNFPVFGSNGVTGYIDNYKIKGPGIIIGRKGSVGRVSYSIENFTPTDTAYYVRIKNNLTDDLKFWYYYLQLLGLEKLNTHSSVPGLSREVAYFISVNVPSKATQQKIASVLSALDDKIELNNKINAELEAMAKTIYDYWFVQFDFPDKNGRPYKSSDGKMVYNEILKREIPEGWEVKGLSFLCSIVSRGISPKYIEDGGVCVLNQKCIRDNKISFDFSRRHDNHYKNTSSRRIKEYDILVNSTGVGTLGRVAMVKRMPEEFITVDSHVTIVRADEKLVDELYFGFTIVQKQKEIEGFSLGSTGQVELSRSQLESLNVILPNSKIQKKFRGIDLPLLQKMAICEIENQNLSNLRDWLLPMLMNGQVSVGKAYEEVEEVVSMAAEEEEEYRNKINI